MSYFKVIDRESKLKYPIDKELSIKINFSSLQELSSAINHLESFNEIAGSGFLKSLKEYLETLK